MIKTDSKPKFDIKEECKEIPVLHATVLVGQMVVTWTGKECLMLELTDPDDNIKVKKLIYPGGAKNVITEKDLYYLDSNISHS